MYEFITIGGGEYFVDIFNSIASVVKNGEYMNVVKIAGAVAFLMAFINAALANSLYDASKWFITTFIVVQLLLVPKSSIHVTDKTNPSLKGAKVDNVPYLLAFSASTASVAGYNLTKLFEAVFSLPDDLKYSENGMLFGVNLYQSVLQARINNSNFSATIDDFIKNCIFYDLKFKIYNLDDLKKADDIWGFIKDKQIENRFFKKVARSGSVSYPSCKDGMGDLQKEWSEELKTPTDLAIFAKIPNITKSLFNDVSVDVNQYLLNVSKSSSQILHQSMMINAIHDATESYEAQNRVKLYQDARASLQTKSTYQAMGSQAGKWIPILKIVIELIFISSFPLMVLVAFLPSYTGTVLKGYFGTFLWLAAWGPLYAILHRVSMGYGQTYSLGLNGLTLYSQAGLENVMEDISSMAGYMSIFVPMLALGIARGGVSAMSSMATSFMYGLQNAVATPVQESTTGNLSFGNVGMNSRMVSSGVSIMNDAGQVGHYHKDGSFTIDNSQVESKFGSFDLRGSERIESALSNSISQEQSFAESKAVQAQQLESEGFEKTISNYHNIEKSKGFEESATQQEKESFSRVKSAVEEFAERNEVTEQKTASIFGEISGGVGLAGFGVKGGGSATSSIADQDTIQKAKVFSENRNLSQDLENIKSFVKSDRFNVSDGESRDIRESFTKSDSLTKEVGIHSENSRRLSEQQQYIETNSLEFDQSYNNEFVHHLRDKYGTESSVYEITNPNNVDHELRNKEINEFNEYKTREVMIQDIDKNKK